MRKLFLSVIAIIAITTSSVFGAYGSGDIDQLQDPDVLKVEFLSLGVLAGSETIRFAVSLNSNSEEYLALGGANDAGGDAFDFNGSIYAGVGYKAPAFGAWLGYEFGYNANSIPADANANPAVLASDAAWAWHAPHLQFTAMDNNFRINIPFTIGMGVSKPEDGLASTEKDMLEGVSALSTEIQARYYTQIEYLTQIRFYVYYGQFDYSGAKNTAFKALDYENSSSVGFQARFYFNIPNDGPVTVDPVLKTTYRTSLGDYGPGTADAFNITASKYIQGSSDKFVAGDNTGTFELKLGLGLGAGNDIVSIYVEPFIGSKTSFFKDSRDETGLIVGNYMEIYLFPTPELQVYLELDTGYNTTDPIGDNQFTLGTSTGVKWFF